jgi:hypothetical protein
LFALENVPLEEGPLNLLASMNSQHSSDARPSGAKRRAFAEGVLKLNDKELQKYYSLSLVALVGQLQQAASKEPAVSVLIEELQLKSNRLLAETEIAILRRCARDWISAREA